MIRGCFNLIKFIITTIFILIILFPCGGLKYIQTLIDNYQHPKQGELTIKTDDFGDFSKEPKEYKFVRSLDMFGINALVAKHNKTDQKMALVDSGWTFTITKKDLQSSNLEGQLKQISSKFPYSPIKLDKLNIIKKGSFNAFGQSIPYVRVKFSLTGNSKNNFEGIIGAVNYPKNKNNLIISFNDSDRYNQQIAEKFFKNIHLKADDENSGKDL